MSRMERNAQNQILNEEARKKRKGIISKILNGMTSLVIVGGIVGLFLMYGPYTGFRDWYITTAMTTMTHKYLATWFYSEETINDVLSRNRMVEIDSVTDPSLVTVTSATGNYTYSSETEREILERDPDHPDYKIIEISGKSYTGYVAFVYDPSKIKTLVTANLNKSGQYVTRMAQDRNAVLAINGGFFIDLKEDRSGGTPQGITITNGKVITDRPYTGEGGLVGFDNNNRLIIGKINSTKVKSMNIRDAVTTGPFLIVNGQASTVLGNGGWGTAPRTAIGQREDGVVIFVVVDGRRVGKPGASMTQLIEIMKKYGAVNAAALDGGTSSVMVENYKILNDPIDSDGKHKTRPVATGFGVIIDEKKNTNNK